MKTIAAILLSCFVLAGTLRAQLSLTLQQRLQDTINHLQTTKKYKGISAAVIWQGHGDWKGTVGLSHPGTPLSHSMVIGIGSNTKTFLAAVILRLVEMGSLSLSDSIGKWLAPMPNIKGSITIAQLLQHTSGIYNYTEHPDLGDSVNNYPFRIWTKAELVSKFVKAPYFLPGQGWYYSNTNFLLAGIIAEMAGGTDVAQLIRQIVLVPAGLNNTFFPPYETITSTPARIWTNFGNGYLQSTTLPDQFYSVADAAGGMLSDAADNTRFWESLFNGTIIQKSTLTQDMMNWKVVGNGLSYGLGIMRSSSLGYPTYSHGGNILGQTTANLADTVRGIYVSVLTNQDSIQNELLVLGLYKILLQQSKLVTGVPALAVSSPVLYPNPAGATISLRNASPVKDVSVMDLSGRLLVTIAVNSTAAEIDLSDLPAGAYLMVLRDGSGQKVSRFFRE